MQDQVITIQPSTQGGIEVCWLDNGPLMRIFDSIAEAIEHASMVAEQAYFENGELWTIRNIAA
jgi:hypothetical protein